MEKLTVNESHWHGDFHVHQNLRFTVGRNRFVCVCGPSGCGKTTLLEMLAGLIRPKEGEILLDGKPVSPKVQNISFVFQEPSTLPWLTVKQNIAVGLRQRGAKKDVIEQVVNKILGIVNLCGFEDYYPRQLSGGMKQRVAIARAFSTEADVILMDEPFVSLDQPTREKMQYEVLRIWEENLTTVVFVTHNIEEAVFLADEILFLSCPPSSVVKKVEIGLPRIRDPLSPEFAEVRRQCVGIMREIEAR